MALLGATSLTGCSSIPDFLGPGYNALFYNSTAPTSWTKVTDSYFNNRALRLVTGSITNGGSFDFTSIFTNRGISGGVSVSGGVGNHTIDWNQMPSHAHGQGAVNVGPQVSSATPFGNAGTRSAQTDTTSAGGNQAHSHPWSGSGSFSTTLDFSVKYADLILATKN